MRIDWEVLVVKVQRKEEIKNNMMMRKIFLEKLMNKKKNKMKKQRFNMKVLSFKVLFKILNLLERHLVKELSEK